MCTFIFNFSLYTRTIVFFSFLSFSTFLSAVVSDKSLSDVEILQEELFNIEAINPNNDFTSQTILNVSYDPTRELFEEYNALFSKWWKERTGQILTIQQSHGGSGKQARSVIYGLNADVVTLALAYDIDAITRLSKNISPDWEKRLPNKSVPFYSTIVFLVRKGNPKHIYDWNDLIKPGIQIITPNPKTSGVARWNYLAAWGYALRLYDRDMHKAKGFMTQLFQNVPLLDGGARAATSTFTQRNIGDVLLTWENEALLAKKEFGDKGFDIIYPSISIYAAPPVTWVDKVVEKRESKKVSEYYLKYLYSKEGQEIAGKHFYRVLDPEVREKYKQNHPDIFLMTIEDFGGWEAAQINHFQQRAIFDQIFEFRAKQGH